MSRSSFLLLRGKRDARGRMVWVKVADNSKPIFFFIVDDLFFDGIFFFEFRFQLIEWARVLRLSGVTDLLRDWCAP